ncbi:MAG: hypothetical protein AAGG01_10200 [Planctomycetota bacterium]
MDASTALALDARTLRALFHDLYGRAPLARERETWIGEAAESLVDAALADEAMWRHWLDEQLYYFMLIDRFEPRDPDLDALPARLAQRRIAPRIALHRIAISSSFEDRNPGADTYVTVVMEQFCGIEVQRSTRELEIGKAVYDGGSGTFLGSRASSQSDVVNIAVNHLDAARHLVAREYERFMRSPCPRRDRTRWAKRIHKSGHALFGLFRSWLVSPEYAARVEKGAPLSNRAWIRSVYVDLGDELPSAEDVEALRGALDSLGDPRPLRSLIVRMLLDQERTKAPRKSEVGEPGPWVDRTFQRLLGRAPRDDERAAFVEVLADGSDGPRLVLQALLTSPEYQKA